MEVSFGEGKAIRFCLNCIVPIMIGLKLIDSTRYEKFIQGTDKSPLLDFSDSETIRRFNGMLSREETFDSTDNTKTTVSVANKLNDIYNALFNTDYNGMTYEKQIGEYIFKKETKETLLRTVGLFSKYSDFEID